MIEKKKEQVMLEKIIAYIEKYSLIERGDGIVVGVSGGADSVCLLLILVELRKRFLLDLVVVHVHHGIRGKEADEDEEFVRNLASQLEIPFVVERRDVPAFARECGLSEEEAGRAVRYEIFEQVRKCYGFTKVAVAHNKNDCAETVLFHLFRGSGLTGISGISASREKVIRPLLCCSRDEIERFLAERGQLFRTDRTNFLEEYSRNKIRLRVLPYVAKEINDRAVEHIVGTAGMVSEAQEFIEKNVQIMYDKVVSMRNGIYFINADEFRAVDRIIQRGILYQVIVRLAKGKKDIEQKHVELVMELMNRSVGKEVMLPYDIVAVRSYDGIQVCKRECLVRSKQKKKWEFVEVKPGNTYLLEEIGYQISLELVKNEQGAMQIPKNDCTKWFDYDRINNVILVRSRQSGDYLEINDKRGRKKLKDYFIDKKIPRDVRDEIPLLTDGSHVMWIFGDRISERYKVSEMTKNILMVNIMEVKKNGR